MAARRGASTTPVRGAPNAVSFDGTTRWFWWGQDAGDADRLLARGGRALAWDTAEECRAAAEAAGSAFDLEQAGPEGSGVLDLHPAQEWLRRRVLFLDSASGLGLWNWALDVAPSTGQVWNQRGTLANRCYDKLFAANVPYFFVLESYRPQWTPRQLRVLRRVLGSACHVIRSAAPAAAGVADARGHGGKRG